MSNKEIIKEVLKNGGLTIDLEEKKGFMCSIYGMEKTFNLEQLEELEKELDNYKNIVKNKKNVYVGLWLDNNIIYLDLSKHYNDKKQAIKKGIENRQLAIYDIEKDKSIDLLKNVYIVYKYNQVNNDFIYLKEFLTIEELKKAFKSKNIYAYISNDLENIKMLYNDNIAIIKDSIYYKEYLEIMEG